MTHYYHLPLPSSLITEAHSRLDALEIFRDWLESELGTRDIERLPHEQISAKELSEIEQYGAAARHSEELGG